jgi:hypothetical protein
MCLCVCVCITTYASAIEHMHCFTNLGLLIAFDLILYVFAMFSISIGELVMYGVQ